MSEKDDFFKRMFSRRKHSVCIAVLGKKQSGKTDFVLYMMDQLHRLGLMDGFGSNMPMEAPFHVDFIEDFQTLKQTCKMLNPDPSKGGLKRYFFFGSEMGKWLPKDQAWRNVNFIEELQTIRKYGLSFIGDAIDRVDSRVLNPTHFDGCFFKYHPTNPTVAYYENWQTGSKTHLLGIPKTRIGFDTWYSARFFMEPQGESDLENVIMNEEHQIIKQYLEHESWKSAGIETKKGKRAVLKVLRYHMKHCLGDLPKESENGEMAKDS